MPGIRIHPWCLEEVIQLVTTISVDGSCLGSRTYSLLSSGNQVLCRSQQAHIIVLPCLRYINSDDWVYEAQTGVSNACPDQGPILSQVSPCMHNQPHTDKAGKQQEGALPCSTAHHRESAICAAW